jgi:hypothetical protein
LALISEGEIKAASDMMRQQRRSVRLAHKMSTNPWIAKGSVLENNKANKKYDIFLSHAYKDKAHIQRMVDFLEMFDLSVYVDWLCSPELDRSKVTKDTAATIRRSMESCSAMLFATSDTAVKSIWMPWELGLFDGVKGRVAIIPITPAKVYNNTYAGQEYLGLYPFVTRQNSSKGTDTLWVHTASDTYISLRMWLSGKNPYKRN